MAKRTKAEGDAIRNDLAELLCEFPTRRMIIQYCTKKYGIKDSQIDKYTKDARIILANTLYSRKERFWQHINAREKMLNVLKSKPDINMNLILRVLDSMAKIEGLNIDRFAMTDAEGKTLPITSITVALQNREDDLDKEEKENE